MTWIYYLDIRINTRAMMVSRGVGHTAFYHRLIRGLALSDIWAFVTALALGNPKRDEPKS